jgi:ABC-type bacteriocin/lantibiotic exporter with double-glycine peptidase domain
MLEAVGLHDFVTALPEGSQTMLNFQGSNVSGGQRQRIGLARGLLRNADVLIMDESTSALDHVTREKIVANIMERYRDRILIFISHDPAVLDKVDQVIQLNRTSQHSLQADLVI